MSIQALALSGTHVFSKQRTQSLTLLPDLGVQGDCHSGKNVQHRSRLHIKPAPKNLRQVHLLDAEILGEYGVEPGELGENITTQGLDLLALGRGSKLHFLPSEETTTSLGNDFVEPSAISEPRSTGEVNEGEMLEMRHPILVVTGLRNPCGQINHFRPGLQERFIERDDQRKIIARRAGVMTTVEVGGVVEVGMRIVVEEMPVWERLECV